MLATHRWVLRESVLSAAIAWSGMAALGACAEPLEVFAVSDAVRVFEDGYGLPDKQAGEVRVFGVRNEVVSAQCVVRANADLKDLTVATGPLQQAGASATLPAEAVEWNFVESIFIEENTRKVDKNDLTRPAPARFPDLLSDERQCALAKGSLKAVYVTVRIPQDAKPGEYRGEVSVRSGDAGATLPLVVTVYPLVMPEDRHVMVTEWFTTRHFQRHHGIDPEDPDAFFKMLKISAENMADHRQNAFRVALELIGNSRVEDGRLHFGFSRRISGSDRNYTL